MRASARRAGKGRDPDARWRLRFQAPPPALALLLTAFASAACGQPQALSAGPAPDAVFFGGVVHTGTAAPLAEAVSVAGGRVVAVGRSSDLLALAGAETQQVDLRGAHLYPGFTDSHAHLLGVGERELTLKLDQVASLADLVAAVKAAAADLPPGETLSGRGWIETHWPEGRFPTRDDLDAVSGDRPVVLTRADGHALVANSAALKAAGLTRLHPRQPEGGRIETDAAGRPTGMLIDRAMEAMAPLSRPRTGAALEAAYEIAAQVYVRRGWTGVHNMSVPAPHIPVLRRLSEAGRLPLRIYNAVDGQTPRLFERSGLFDAPDTETARTGLVVTRAIKLYMDGALGSRGALLFAPYADQPDASGLQIAREEPTHALLRKARAAGVQVAFHAIGDKGNSLALDWIGRVLAEPTAADATAPDGPAGAAASPGPGPAADPRWRIEHAQILAPADIPRFAALGVVASMQPSHAIGDLYFAPDRLGADRLSGAYAWSSLIAAGAVVAGGSDAPVEQGDPRIEFYAAVARKDLKGRSGGEAWRPQEAVSREDALKMFTAWPAYASFREAELGSIEPGKLADFTAFSRDILTAAEADILTAEPVLTVVGGAIAWQRP